MSASVIVLALFAAISHATWNAFLRTGADRLWSVTVMSFAVTAVAIPFAIILPAPPASAWPYLVVSSCLQVGYSVFLVSAYRHGELGQVYPIVRGSVPLLVTFGGFVLAGERLGADADARRRPRCPRYRQPRPRQGPGDHDIHHAGSRHRLVDRQLRHGRCHRRSRDGQPGRLCGMDLPDLWRADACGLCPAAGKARCWISVRPRPGRRWRAG